MLERLQLHEHGTIWRQIGRQLVTKAEAQVSDHTAGKVLARRINMVKVNLLPLRYQTARPQVNLARHLALPYPAGAGRVAVG